ncbi:MAG: flagellar biosynthesis anti-sigma factor FlgM [bacterium]
MSIEGVNSTQIIQKLKGIEKSARQKSGAEQSAGRSDRVNISNNARLARTVARAQKAIQEAPEVRADRVAEVKERLAEGYYDSPEVIDEVAQSITDVFMGR